MRAGTESISWSSCVWWSNGVGVAYVAAQYLWERACHRPIQRHAFRKACCSKHVRSKSVCIFDCNVLRSIRCVVFDWQCKMLANHVHRLFWWSSNSRRARTTYYSAIQLCSHDSIDSHYSANKVCNLDARIVFFLHKAVKLRFDWKLFHACRPH